MAKKVKIRVLSNCYTVITVVLSVICITVSFLGFQKYSVLRSAMNDYVTCEAAAQPIQPWLGYLNQAGAPCRLQRPSKATSTPILKKPIRPKTAKRL